MATNTCDRTWDIVVKNATGAIKQQIISYYSLKVSLSVNKPGTLTLELPSIYCTTTPRNAYQVSDFTCDDRVEVWLDTTGFGNKKLFGDTAFIVTDSYSQQDDNGIRKTIIEAEAAMGILRSRINPYDADSAFSDFPATASDDAMKQIVRNNFGPTASSHAFAPGYGVDSIRSAIATSGYLSVQANSTSIVNTWEGDIENANVLDTLQRIAEYSFSQNEPLFFDIVQTAPFGNFEFRTFTGQRGVDRTITTGGINAVTISPNNNTISQYELRFSCKDYITRVYAAGEGTGAARLYRSRDAAALTAAGLANDPFLLRESFLSVNSDNATDVDKDGDAELAKFDLAVQLSGKLGETSSFIYGVNWDFGDRVTAYVEGINVDVFVDSIAVSIEGGQEQIDATFSTDLVKRQTGVGRLFQLISNQRKLIETIYRRE